MTSTTPVFDNDNHEDDDDRRWRGNEKRARAWAGAGKGLETRQDASQSLVCFFFISFFYLLIILFTDHTNFFMHWWRVQPLPSWAQAQAGAGKGLETWTGVRTMAMGLGPQTSVGEVWFQTDSNSVWTKPKPSFRFPVSAFSIFSNGFKLGLNRKPFVLY